jgi:predicted kinase
MDIDSIINHLDEDLPDATPRAEIGSLLLMVGLPASGKSSVVKALRQHLSFVVISTDFVRAYFRDRPNYTPAELSQVYTICHRLIERRLRRKQRVVFDASNHLAVRREQVIKVAHACGAPVAICLVQAAQEAARQRLKKRNDGRGRKDDLSDADWSVYKWMVEVQEPLVRPHIVLDTTSSDPAVLAQRLYDYWKDVETNAASHPDLQSSRWARQLGGHA